MRALVVYESMFGNTREVAGAIADGLARHATVVAKNLDDVTDADIAAADLVVAGGPTHALGMSREKTRTEAAKENTPLVTARNSLREWIEHLAAIAPSARCAVFGTKAATPRFLPGSAAKSAGRYLRRHRVTLIAKPENFYVTGMQGPLAAGELDRAAAWGEQLATIDSALPKPH